MTINELAPLATDLHWFFDVNSDMRSVRSIFRLKEDESGRLNDGEFDVSVDTGNDYVEIFANRATLDTFNEVRKESRFPMPTVFTSAVLSVLAVVKDLEDDSDDENCAWLSCVRTQLRSRNLDIGGPGFDGSHSLLLAAQRLLSTPFAILLEDYADADDTDE